MRLCSSVSRYAYVVEKSLKICFPKDFDARCMYAAFGMHYLAKKQGHQSIIVAGDFIALSVARDNGHASFQGYKDKDGEFGHYWCEIDSHTVDLGPMFLPVSSPYPAAAAPIIMWPTNMALPTSLRYVAKIRYSTDVKPLMANEIMARLKGFRDTCHERFSKLAGQPKLKSWVLTGPVALNTAAAKGDLWAIGSKRLELLPKQDLGF